MICDNPCGAPDPLKRTPGPMPRASRVVRSMLTVVEAPPLARDAGIAEGGGDDIVGAIAFESGLVAACAFACSSIG